MFFERLRIKRFNERKIAREAISWTDGLTSGTFLGRGRVVVNSVEGPRFDPTDFAALRSVEELDDQIDALFGGEGTRPLTPEGK